MRTAGQLALHCIPGLPDRSRDMKIVAICLVTVGVAAVILPLYGAESPPPGNKTPTAIIITNKTDNSTLTRPPYLSAGLPEIVKMHKAGVDAAVLLAFVQNSPTA